MSVIPSCSACLSKSTFNSRMIQPWCNKESYRWPFCVHRQDNIRILGLFLLELILYVQHIVQKLINKEWPVYRQFLALHNADNVYKTFQLVHGENRAGILITEFYLTLKSTEKLVRWFVVAAQCRLRLGQILTRRAETWEGRRHGNLGCFVSFSAMVNREAMASFFNYRVSILRLNCPQDKPQIQLTRKPEHLNNTPQRGLNKGRKWHHAPSASVRPEEEERKMRTDRGKKMKGSKGRHELYL